MPEILIWLKSTIETLNSYPQSLTLDQWFFVGGLLALIIAIIIHEEFRFFNWFFNRISPEPKTECGTLVGSLFITGTIAIIFCVCLQVVNRVAQYLESPVLYKTNNFTNYQRINSLISQANHLEMIKERWSDRKKLGTFIDIKRDFSRYLCQLNREVERGKYKDYPIMAEACQVFSQTENRPDFQLFKCLVENGVTLSTLRDIRKYKYLRFDTTTFFASYRNKYDNNGIDNAMGYYAHGYPDSIVVYLDKISTINDLRDVYVHELAHAMTSIFISQDNLYLYKIQTEGIASYTEMKVQPLDGHVWLTGYIDNYLPLFTIIYSSPSLNDAFRIKKDSNDWAKNYLNEPISKLDGLIRHQSNGQPLDKNITDACKNRWQQIGKLVSYYREFAKKIPGGESRLDLFLNKFKFWFSN